MKRVVYFFWLAPICFAQEAGSGFDVRTTISAGAFYSDQLTETPRDGAPAAAGFRWVLYPTWKISSHWTVAGAIQTQSRPYLSEDFSSQGYGVRTNILQGYLCYSQFWNGGSVAVRMGQLSTAFGSFPLRYDDTDNPLIDLPTPYGYYYSTVSILGHAGAQVDANIGKVDFRAQLVNSSPANPRSILAHDQYANWAGGAGYTIRQGLRIGASTYHGPYLDRHSPFFFPGEAAPVSLPATAFGVDAQWGHGAWNLYGEWQHFRMDYRAIPVFTEHAGYGEARYVLSPRWYVAARLGYVRANAFNGHQSYEFAAGYRANQYQVLKVGYEVAPGSLRNTVALQLVTSFRAFSIAAN